MVRFAIPTIIDSTNITKKSVAVQFVQAFTIRLGTLKETFYLRCANLETTVLNFIEMLYLN